MRRWGLRRVGVAALSAFSAALIGAVGSSSPVSAAVSPHLSRYPYLTDVTTTSAVVNLATDASSPAAVVTFGPAGSGCATSSATATATTITVGSRTEYQFKAQLSGLNANTSYCYRAGQSGVDLLGSDASPTFTTATVPGDTTPYSFAVLGDWGAGTSDEAKVLARIAQSPAKFVVTVGDNVYNSGTQTEYGDLSGGNVFAPSFWKGVGATRPVFPAQGNHGFSQNLPYLQNFPEPKVVQSSGARLQQDSYCCIPPMPSSKTYASAWYAFDWGAARFYVLEAAWSDTSGAYQGDFDAHWNGPVPGCAACGTELQWLQADLAAHATTAIKFAFFHYPLHADSTGQPSDTYLDGPNRLEGLLAKNGVQVVFNGHAHMYERNRPQIPGTSMVSYVTGGGGDTLGTVAGCSAFDAYAIGLNSSCNAPKPTSYSQVYHYLLVSVAANTITVAPTDENGNTFDVQTYSTNAAPVTTIDSSPAALTNATSAAIAFHSTASAPTFTCALDGGSPSPCTSPASLNALTAGSHTFTIATTAAGGPNPSPASCTWTVDTSPPSPPGGLTATATSPVTVGLTWTASTDDTGVAGYDIFRDSAPIGSVGSTTTTFVDGTVSAATTYQYTIDARDGAGNVSSLSAPAGVTTPSSGGPSQPWLVQAAGASETVAGTSLSATLPTPTASGHLLVLSAGLYTGITNPITSVTDTAGNAWTRIGAFAVSGHYSDGEMWYAANAAAVTSVTVHTASAAVIAIDVEEFAGIATTNPLDVSTGTSNTGTAAGSGPTTPTGTGDLVVGFIAGHGKDQPISVTAPGYTVRPQQTSNGGSSIASVVTGSQVLTAAGTQTFTGSFSSSMYWAAGIACFKVAP